MVMFLSDTGALLCCISSTASLVSGRKQEVEAGYASSPSAPVVSGVPQGSVIGPLLFFANDFGSLLTNDFQAYTKYLKSYIANPITVLIK